jgi:hypothetical protein
VTTGSASIKNIIWTAGHCVANGGHSLPYELALLSVVRLRARGRESGRRLLELVGREAATTSNDWFVSGTFSRDYAIIALQHSGTVKNADVATVTGGLGFAWNWGRDQAWFFLGYPQASPGGKIIATASEHRYDDSSQGNPPTNSWGSNQTPGASGSPGILFLPLAVAISTLTQATSTRVRPGRSSRGRTSIVWSVAFGRVIRVIRAAVSAPGSRQSLRSGVRPINGGTGPSRASAA